MIAGGSPADGVLQAFDRVITVNGIPIGEMSRLRKAEEKLRRGDTVTYRVERRGRIFDVPIRLASPLRSPFVVIKSIVALVVAFIFVIVALVVFNRRPDDRRVLIFYAFALVSALAVLGSAATVFENSGGRGVAPSIGFSGLTPLLFFACTIAYAPLILHLSLIFPSDRPIVARRPYVIRWIYAGALLVGLMLMLLVAALALFLQDPNAPQAAHRFGHIITRSALFLSVAGLLVALHVIYAGRAQGIVRAFARRPFRAAFAILAFFIASVSVIGRYGSSTVAVIVGFSSIIVPLLLLLSYPVLATIALVRNYRAAGVEEKRQVQWPVWGLVTALSTSILLRSISFAAAVGMTSAGKSIIDWRVAFQTLEVIPTVVSLIVPLSFAAAILKYRLMNIDVIIRKTVVYAILSGTIVVLYLVLVGGLGTLLINVAGLQNQTMVVASTLVVALLFVPVRNKLQTLVDRNLFRHKYDYPAAIRAVSAETLTSTDLGSFLFSAAEKIQQALQNRAVVIFATRHDDFVAAAKVGVADSFVGVHFARAPLTPFLDRPFDPRRHDIPVESATALRRMEAVLVVPINTPNTPANGFIALASKLSGAPFDVEDIDFLRSIADQLDLGMDRIRAQREEVDYAHAREIQESLLPREMPRIERLDVSGIWQPARTMGGDYYDLLKLGDRELAVCIGDVAGKGMSAALTMSGLQAAVRASASDSPRDLCVRVRRVVVSSLSGGRFVTFFYATIDTASMKLRWCNAGHNAPVLARADGSVFRLDGGGPAFSRLTSGDKYEELETSVAPGDRIVLFTDGVSEAGAGTDMFGEQRIEELVVENREADARTLQQRIVDAATTHAGGELEDDLTLVVVAVGNAGVHAG